MPQRSAVVPCDDPPPPTECVVLSWPEAEKHDSSTTNRRFLFYAALAGTCGALSAVSGKLAVAEGGGRALVTCVASLFPFLRSSGASWPGVVALAGRCLLYAASVLLTALMWRWHLTALAHGPTPLCQTVNAGINFAVSAIFGFLIFGETITFTWMVGAVFVVVGLTLVVSDKSVSLR